MANMVKDYGMANRDDDDNSRKMYCPLCLTCDGKERNVVIITYPKLGVTTKAIGRELITSRNKQVYRLNVTHVERKARRTRVRLTVGMAALHTL